MPASRMPTQKDSFRVSSVVTDVPSYPPKRVSNIPRKIGMLVSRRESVIYVDGNQATPCQRFANICMHTQWVVLVRGTPTTTVEKKDYWNGAIRLPWWRRINIQRLPGLILI